MKYDTLQQILEYIVENNLKLTKNERKLLLKLEEPSFNDKSLYKTKNISLDDFVTWYNSPVRTKKITDALLTQKITKRNLESLLQLENEDIKNITEEYHNLNQYDLGYLTLCYAKLKQFQKNSKYKSQKDYPRKLTKLISENIENCKENNVIRLIQNDILFPRYDLIELLVKEKDEKKYIFIEDIIEGYAYESINTQKIMSKYIEVVLKNNTNKPLYRCYDFDIITKASKRYRAIDAILKQDSIEKINQILYAAANNGIYKNKKAFSLIQSQKDEKKMENMREISRINQMRKYPRFLEWFATLEIKQQTNFIEQYYKQEKIKNNEKAKEKNKPFIEINNQINEDLSIFSQSTTIKSAKKLSKTLINSFKKYPKIKENDTK